jgi:hypothetical protein
MTITRKCDANPTYRMSSIFCSVEVHHTIDTGEGLLRGKSYLVSVCLALEPLLTIPMVGMW